MTKLLPFAPPWKKPDSIDDMGKLRDLPAVVAGIDAPQLSGKALTKLALINGIAGIEMQRQAVIGYCKELGNALAYSASGCLSGAASENAVSAKQC